MGLAVWVVRWFFPGGFPGASHTSCGLSPSIVIQSALIITGLGPMLMGRSAAFLALCMSYEIEPEDAALLSPLDLGDIIAALELREETSLPLEKILN